MLQKTKSLVVGCGAHFVQDGLVALQYVLLPLIAQSLSLNYAQVGVLRAIGHTAMTVMEIPAGMMADRLNVAILLGMGLLGASLGYYGISLSVDFVTVAVFFLLAGLGAAFQHSLASAMIVHAYAGGSRRWALGLYNSFGDAGKLTFTGLFSVGIGIGLAWTSAVQLLAIFSAVFGGCVIFWLRTASHRGVAEKTSNEGIALTNRWGILNPRRFAILGTVVFLDSLIQAVFLTFIAFYLLERGVPEAVAGLGVVLVLVGGMLGKFFCGATAARFGDRNTFIIIQILTVLGILILDWVPLSAVLFLLPFVGLVIQGSSTVTYGATADLIHKDRQSRGYALIYTLASGSSVAGPFLFGLYADASGLSQAFKLLALIAVLTVPLAVVLPGKFPMRT
ncbi:MAG: FSR family fosmidomycin resistance protein-like MFS transporter [Gammaproteobacteria bacterium]|jgi:FSR family fosmidomycin resistance protein-like MFS transporter